MNKQINVSHNWQYTSVVAINVIEICIIWLLFNLFKCLSSNALAFGCFNSSYGKSTSLNSCFLRVVYYIETLQMHEQGESNRSCNIYDLEAIDSACRLLSQQSFYIDDTSQRSVGQIKSSAKRMHQRGLCDLIIIDYLQLAEMKSEHRNYNRQDMVSEASSDAKRLAKDLQVPVLLLSQLNRGLETRPGKRPELADLRDSGAIEQDADVVLLIHRPEFYGMLEDRQGNSTKGRGELLIAKNRNGSTGTVLFAYNESMTRIGGYGK